MLFLPVVVLLLALVVAGLLGLGRLAFGRRGEGERVLPGVLPIVGLVAALGVVGVVGAGLLVGAGRDRHPDDPSVTTPIPLVPAPEPTPAPAPAPLASPVLGPVVSLAADEPDATTFPRTYPAAGGLRPDTVLRVRATGFPPFAAARAMQCVTAGDRRTCANAVTVQFGEDGAASFQYLVGVAFAPAAREGGCRVGAATCSIVVEEVDGERRAELQTVFGEDLPPPGRIRVTPRTGVADGGTVVVEVEGYPPGARVQVMLCAPPAATGTRRCGPPGPTAPMTIASDGTGRATLTVRTGPVGRDRVACGRGQPPCGVSVASASVFARVPVVPIRFVGPSGASYDATRVGAGLAAALLLLGAAGWLIRRTDWSPIGEEAAPELDEAEYADLDAIVAALPPEEEPAAVP